MKLSNFEAHIIVDGKELPEYNFAYDERTKTASCWVPSQAGKHFSVSGMPVGGYDANTVAKVFADGNYVDGFIFRQGMERHPVTWSGVRISVTSTKPLIFDLTDFTDDDSLLNCTNTKELGDITLHVFYAEIMTRLDGYRKLESEANFANKIHEQTKKAITHKVKLGQEIENPIENLYQVRFLSPICRLIFRYRSIDVLRADGIVPPAPTASQAEGKRKALGNDGDKSEDSEKSMRTRSKKAKTEHHPNCEVIDLTL